MNIMRFFQRLGGIKISVIILICLTCSLSILLHLRYYDPKPVMGDGLTYETIAKKIVTFETTLDNGYDIASAVTPGYPAIIALCYRFSGSNPLVIYLLQSLMYIASVLICFYLMRKTTNIRFAFWCAIWLACYIPLWKYNFEMMMEVPTVFFLVLSLYFLLKHLEKGSLKTMIWFSLVFSWLIFMNNRFIMHYSVFLLVLLLIHIQKWHKLKVSHYVIGFTLVVILIGSWHLRQYITFGQLVIFAPARVVDQDSWGSQKFYSYEDYKELIGTSGLSSSSKKAFDKEFTLKKYNSLQNEYKKRTRAKIYFSRAIEFCRVVQLDITLGNDDTRLIPPASKEQNLINFLLLFPAFLLAPIGFFFAIRKRNIFYIIISSFIIAHWVLHALVHYISRYRLTILPLVFMLAFFGLFHLGNAFKNSRNKSFDEPKFQD